MESIRRSTMTEQKQRTSNGGGGEEDGDSPRDVLSAIPQREVEGDLLEANG